MNRVGNKNVPVGMIRKSVDPILSDRELEVKPVKAEENLTLTDKLFNSMKGKPNKAAKEILKRFTTAVKEICKSPNEICDQIYMKWIEGDTHGR